MKRGKVIQISDNLINMPQLSIRQAQTDLHVYIHTVPQLTMNNNTERYRLLRPIGSTHPFSQVTIVENIVRVFNVVTRPVTADDCFVKFSTRI